MQQGGGHIQAPCRHCLQRRQSESAVKDIQAIFRINPGDIVLIHQTRGNGAGQWELNKAAEDFTGSGTFTLQEPLQYTYVTNSGNERA